MSDYLFTRLDLAHIEWARQLHNDPEVLSMLTDPHIVTPEEQEEWYFKMKHSKSSQRLVVSDGITQADGTGPTPIALVRADQIDEYNGSVCIGLDIHKDFRGKGHAKPIYRQLIDGIFINDKFNRVWLFVASYNTRAIKLYEGLGFQREGVQRQALKKGFNHYDYIMMSILRSEWSTKDDQISTVQG